MQTWGWVATALLAIGALQIVAVSAPLISASAPAVVTPAGGAGEDGLGPPPDLKELSANLASPATSEGPAPQGSRAPCTSVAGESAAK